MACRAWLSCSGTTGVGVDVGVLVGVSVGVRVGLAVGLAVGVGVDVDTRVAVASGVGESPSATSDGGETGALHPAASRTISSASKSTGM